MTVKVSGAGVAPAKKAAKKAVVKVKAAKPEPVIEVPREEQMDSMGRRIGKRGQRRDLEDGHVLLTGEERKLLRDIASRAEANKGVSAFDRAMALEVGEWDVAPSTSFQSFAMHLAQAKKQGRLDGREFNYTTSGFAPGIGQQSVGVLWIQRTA